MKSQMRFFSYAVFIAVTILAAMIGCRPEEYSLPSGDNPNSVAGVIKSDADFSLLASALNQAELVRPLNDAGPFTVFAPNNAAFQAGGITNTTIDTVKTARGKNFLMGALTYHMLGATTLQTIADTDSSATNFRSLNGNQVYVTQSSAGTVINGARITATRAAVNGVTYVIDRFLPVPTRNIPATVSNNPNLSFLLKAVQRADLVTALSDVNAGFTVFAPTDDAFRRAGFPDTNAVKSANPEVLRNILLYHVTPRAYFSRNLVSRDVRTLLGRTRRISIRAGATVMVTDERSGSATVSQADIITTNGVVHIIDRVLLPNN